MIDIDRRACDVRDNHTPISAGAAVPIFELGSNCPSLAPGEAVRNSRVVKRQQLREFRTVCATDLAAEQLMCEVRLLRPGAAPRCRLFTAHLNVDCTAPCSCTRS
jgi:hypothetical protein